MDHRENRKGFILAVLREGQNGPAETSSFDFMISRVDLEWDFPFELRFGRLGPE